MDRFNAAHSSKSGAKLFVITAMRVMVDLLTLQVKKPYEVGMDRTAFQSRAR